MKKILKNIIYFFLNIFLSIFFKNRGAAVLMYHSVSDNNLFFTVKLEDFEKQMGYLNDNKFNVISLAELCAFLKNKEKIPAKTVVLTFDDGYEDNYTNAFPILKKYNFPAIIFLTTGLIGKEKDKHGLKMLDWDKIKEMNDSGLINFEPHTVNHPRLSKINLSETEKEILESRKLIEKELNKRCGFFAYPYGDYNKEIINIVKDNFDLALTVEKGKINLFKDLFRLNRNSIDSAVGFNKFKYIVK